VAGDFAHLSTSKTYAGYQKALIDDLSKSPIKSRGGVVGAW
jgi:hypothetical protein